MQTVCSHADRQPAPCGWDQWCQEAAGHDGPHTGQATRCGCGLTYEQARERYISSGDNGAFQQMLRKVS